MSQRLVVGLSDEADAEALITEMQRLSVERVDAPRPELPGVVVVTLREAADATRMREEIAGMDGVAYVEPETLYEAFGD